MIHLFSKGIPLNVTAPIISCIGESTNEQNQIFVIRSIADLDELKEKPLPLAILVDGDFEADFPESFRNVPQIKVNTQYLAVGDIVRIGLKGEISTLFRKDSLHNSLFITERCNSNCLMCSQPPKNRDDLDYFWEINTKLIPQIPKNTRAIGITGGEPTLLGSRFVHLLSFLKLELPETEVHVLTNGRSFAWKEYVQNIAEVGNSKVVFGIPLYSDYHSKHDYIVQAKDAFDQTMLGIYNLERFEQRVEIRIVLHLQTFSRLPQLAQYIFKNLPFVEHVAFMGLEYTGYTLANKDLLWIEPEEYMNQLEEAVFFLIAFGMNVSIYNLPLCLLKPSLWQFSRNSISDWKRDYLEECQACDVLEKCGGVFGTSKKLSNRIKSISWQ